MVLRALLLAFPPLHVALEPRVVAFDRKNSRGRLTQRGASVGPRHAPRADSSATPEPSHVDALRLPTLSAVGQLWYLRRLPARLPRSARSGRQGTSPGVPGFPLPSLRRSGLFACSSPSERHRPP